jgi:hypothetical protein
MCVCPHVNIVDVIMLSPPIFNGRHAYFIDSQNKKQNKNPPFKLYYFMTKYWSGNFQSTT